LGAVAMLGMSSMRRRSSPPRGEVHYGTELVVDGLRARLVRGRDQRFESPFLRRRVRSHQCPAVQLAKNAEREAARRFHKSDPFSRIDLILRLQTLSQLLLSSSLLRSR